MGEPAALVEYKNERAATQWSTHPSYRAMIKLGTRAGVPVFAVRYKSDFSEWKVVPLNELSRKFLPNGERASMTEREYVSLLYEIRGRKPPDDIFDNHPVEI